MRARSSRVKRWDGATDNPENAETAEEARPYPICVKGGTTCGRLWLTARLPHLDEDVRHRQAADEEHVRLRLQYRHPRADPRIPTNGAPLPRGPRVALRAPKDDAFVKG